MYKKQNVQYYCKFHRLELAVKLITPSFSWGSGISLVFNRSWRDPRPYWRHANKNIFRLKKTADLNNKTSNSRKNQFSKNLSVHERVLKAAAIIYYCHKMAMGWGGAKEKFMGRGAVGQTKCVNQLICE